MLDGPFVPRTLADVISAIEQDEGLAPARRRDLRSAVRRVCQWLGREPAALPASLPQLRKPLNDFNASALGVSHKTLQNARANFQAALKQAGAASGTRRQPLAEDWEALWQTLPDKRLRNGLSRFLHFCSDEGIDPLEVDDGTVDAFLDHLENATLVTKPKDRHRQTTRLWNEAATRLSGWPERRLAIPDYRPARKRLALEAFPESFQTELARYLAWLGKPDPFDERSRKALKPSTIRQRAEDLRLAASSLVERGYCRAEEIRGLSDLVAPDAFREVFRFYNSPESKADAPFQHGLSTTLIAMAAGWLRLDQEAVSALRRDKQKLPKVRGGMTAKNRACLRQFDDAAALRRLHALPANLFAEACRDREGSEKAAIKAQQAVAIELLLNLPLRSQNVISLALGRSLLRPGGAGSPYRIVIEGAETKNGDPIEVALPEQLTAMIDRYMAHFHPRLAELGNSHLFPARKGQGHKAQATLAQQVCKTIRERAGITMTLHQFRHLAGWFYLRANPGDHVTLQRLLGHKNIKTTMNAYAEVYIGRAASTYDQLLADERKDALAAPPSRKQRRRS